MPRKLVIGLIAAFGLLLGLVVLDRQQGGDTDHATELPSSVVDATSGQNPPAYPPVFPSSTSAPIGPDQLDLCGVGLVSTQRPGLLAATEREANEILTSEARRLQKSGSEAERSLGLALEARMVGLDVWRRATQESPNCFNEQACVARTEREWARVVSPIVDALARMAVATRDPQVYANALHSCFSGAFHAPANCTRVTFEQWAALEPTNALPWIGAASEARRRGDQSAENAAMRRVAEAQSLDSRYIPAPNLIGDLPKTSEATRAHVLAELAFFHGANPFGAYTDLAVYCRKPNLDDPARMTLCRDIVRVFNERGKTFLDFSIAVTLAAQTGTPAGEVAALREELKRLQASMSMQGESLYSCDWLAKAEQWIPRVSREGELQYARSLLSRQSVNR